MNYSFSQYRSVRRGSALLQSTLARGLGPVKCDNFLDRSL